MCPPTIYGKGRGVGNTKSRQVYVMANMTLRRGRAPIIGTGKASMDDVHMHDLTDLYIKMVDAALNPKPEIDEHIWGPKEGYLLAEGGYHVWGEVAQWVAEAAHAKGYIKDTTLEVSFPAVPFSPPVAESLLIVQSPWTWPRPRRSRDLRLRRTV